MAKKLLIALVLLSSFIGFFGCTAISNRVDVVPILQKPDLFLKHHQKIKVLRALNIEEYSSDLELSNGYHLNYFVDTVPDYGEWLQYMELKKDERVIDTITDCSYGLSHTWVGYVLHDCGDYFIYSRGNSVGYQPFTEVYEKSTGLSINSGFYIDYIKETERFYYTKNEFVDERDTIFSLDLIDFSEDYFVPPSVIQNSGEELRMADIYEYRGLAFLTYLDKKHLLIKHS